MKVRLIKLLAVALPAIIGLCGFREPVKPDMEAIRAAVTNPASEYYYPHLMSLYQQNETIMNNEQYRHLYLGSVFQEDYNPYRHSPYTGLVEELYYKSQHTRQECDSIIKYAQLSLACNPFDLRQINFLIYAYREKKKDNIANIWQFRMNHLLEAIVSTGTGLDADNAWYVVQAQHEYDILNLMGRVAESQEFVSPWFDYITLRPKTDKDPSGYYFNIRHILEEYFRKFPDSTAEDEDDDEVEEDVD
jgi:hypothetical protein